MPYVFPRVLIRVSSGRVSITVWVRVMVRVWVRGSYVSVRV